MVQKLCVDKKRIPLSLSIEYLYGTHIKRTYIFVRWCLVAAAAVAAECWLVEWERRECGIIGELALVLPVEEAWDCEEEAESLRFRHDFSGCMWWLLSLACTHAGRH